MKRPAKLQKSGGLLLLVVAVAIPASRGACASGSCSLPVISRTLLPLAAAAPPPQVWNRDPLTEEEADRLRETAALPDKRMEVLVEFATARMAKIDAARAQEKPAASRGQRIHHALEEFARVMDEIDDNIDDYESRKMDMRKGLQMLIEADTIFESKLTDLALAAQDEGASARDYQFVLQDATEVVSGQLQLAREVLQEQERRAEEEKEKKKKQGSQMDRDYQRR